LRLFRMARMDNESAEQGSSRPKVFLSSVFKDKFGEQFREVPLRKRIIENRASLPVELWAYEHFWPPNSENPEPDADTIIDRCFAGIKQTDLFVFLLTGRHGSGATYFEKDPTWASYLELELFAASALRKPILVLHLRGHEPDDALRDTMVLLNRTFASGQYVVDDEDGLYEQFRLVCAALAGGTWNSRTPGVVSYLPEWLSIRRTQSDLVEDLTDPRLAFLDGRFRAKGKKSDPDRAARLLAQVSSGVRTVAGKQGILPHGAALFRLWAAMRELMDDKGSGSSDPAIAALWDRGFGLWAGKASWFGLHGHVWMGPLAAINSQITLRGAFVGSSAFAGDRDVREPLGARASAIYSIAQKMETRRRKFYHYRQTVRLATQALDRDAAAQQGVLSIRGHALMHMAQLGHVWKLWEAVEDFTKSLDLRTKSGASPASIGEAQVDLGFCKVLYGRRSTGLAMMKEGVALLRTDESANGKAFLARGLKKLELGTRLMRALDTMNEARQERLSLSEDIEALDQARDI
jgi:hypothetical protein